MRTDLTECVPRRQRIRNRKKSVSKCSCVYSACSQSPCLFAVSSFSSWDPWIFLPVARLKLRPYSPGWGDPSRPPFLLHCRGESNTSVERNFLFRHLTPLSERFQITVTHEDVQTYSSELPLPVE